MSTVMVLVIHRPKFTYLHGLNIRNLILRIRDPKITLFEESNNINNSLITISYIFDELK